MIKTKCLFDPPETVDGRRYLVTRYHPRRTIAYDAWLRDLAPSERLLARWKRQEISWEMFTALYRGEMTAQVGLLHRLAEESLRGTITLLCYEAEQNPRCHRYLLQKLIETV
jgi:uncharacterized protein YeaO (DUF488 family)